MENRGSRPPAPFYWERRGGWYAKLDRKNVALLKGPRSPASERTAAIHLGRILASVGDGGSPVAGSMLMVELIDLFLVRTKRDRAESTYRWYKGHLDLFAGRVGDVKSSDLRPKHVAAWIEADGPGWGESTRRGAITAAKAVTSWGYKQGHLDADPLRGVERPRMRRREATSPETFAKLLDTVKDEPFRDLLIALDQSGCRPGEVFKVEAKDFDPAERTWTIRGKTTDRTGKMRVVYLTDELTSISKRLAEKNPDGPLFRNADGNPWNRNAVRCRMLRRKAKVGKVQAYGIRHKFATDALAKVPPAVAAELLGHSDLRMVAEHYGHLDERADTLRRAVSEIRRSEAPRTRADARSE